ncbi:acyl-CoA thioesterase [Rhodovibrionaceae bacterium A322]
MAFQRQYKVRFQHCDPAGIVFYPRYFEMVNALVEDWFADQLDCSFSQLHLESGLGVPTARLTSNFTAPSRLGDLLEMTLQVVKLGGSSLQLHVEAHCGDQSRFTAEPLLVLIKLETGRPCLWPDDLRTRLSAELASFSVETQGT